jgi:hypothetical protein
MKKRTVFTGILSLALVFGMLLFVGCPAEDDGGNNTGGDNTSGDNTGGDNTGGGNTGGDNTGGDNTGGDNTGGNTTSKNITVYMEKPADWSQLYAYVWDDSGKEFTAATPGTALTTASSGFYSYQAQSVEYGYVNVRFNDGGSNTTLDILGVDADTYYKSAGAYSGDSSQVLVRSSNTATITTPQFKTKEKTDSTITLTWDTVPGIDGYVLYDEFFKFDDNDKQIPGSEFWHFQRWFVPGEREFLDDNYGQYLDPDYSFKWKLVAVKYKDNADLSGLDSIAPDYLSESDYSPYYTVVHNFGELEVKTLESSLPAPTNLQVVATGSTSVELTWNKVPSAEYYMVCWYDDEADEWLYIEEAYDNQYIDADEEFIFPDSSYKYLVVAHSEKTYSKDSNEITAYTKPAGSASIVRSASDISRAVAVNAPPSSVVAEADSSAAKQIYVGWNSVNGVDKYEIGLFTSPSASSLVKSSTKTASKTLNYTYKSVPVTYGAYYIGVRADGNSKNDWKFTSYAVSAFPTISIKSAIFSSPKSGFKTLTIKMNATWKADASYTYNATLIDATNKAAGGIPVIDKDKGTITISNVPSGPKYTLTVIPSTGGIYGKALTKAKL